MTNPSIVGTTHLDYGTRTNSTVIKPTGTIIAGMKILVYLLLENGATAPSSLPTGFSQKIAPTRPTTSGDGSATYTALYEKTATSSEPSTYVFNHASTATEAMCAVIKDFDPTTPYIVTPTVNTGSGSPINATGINTGSIDGCLIVYLGNAWFGWHENTAPSGFTNANYIADRGLLFASKTQTPAGSTGTVGATSSTNTGHPYVAFLIAIQPVAAATGNLKIGSTDVLGIMVGTVAATKVMLGSILVKTLSALAAPLLAPTGFAIFAQ